MRRVSTSGRWLERIWPPLTLPVLLALLLFGCRAAERAIPATNPQDEAAAEEALTSFFATLAAGRYSAAQALYGGSYETLVGWNPDVAPDDLATLWRDGCSINGLACLEVRSAERDESSATGVYLFNVEFSTREGELFILGPCCGVTETEQPPVSLFPIRVARGQDGAFRVIDLPPYGP